MKPNKINSITDCDFLKFVIPLRDGHYGYSLEIQNESSYAAANTNRVCRCASPFSNF